MKVFLTVGTTNFDDLVKEVDKDEVKSALANSGYTHIECQIGSGTYTPSLPNFSYAPSLSDKFQSADLVVSHAGAGSILEALRLGKKLIVVVNQKLMNNHQLEISRELSQRSHLLMCESPSQLLDTILLVNSFNPVPLPPPQTNILVNQIEKLLS